MARKKASDPMARASQPADFGDLFSSLAPAKPAAAVVDEPPMPSPQVVHPDPPAKQPISVNVAAMWDTPPKSSPPPTPTANPVKANNRSVISPPAERTDDDVDTIIASQSVIAAVETTSEPPATSQPVAETKRAAHETVAPACETPPAPPASFLRGETDAQGLMPDPVRGDPVEIPDGPPEMHPNLCRLYVVSAKEIDAMKSARAIASAWSTPVRGEVVIVVAEPGDVACHRNGVARYRVKISGCRPITADTARAWGVSCAPALRYAEWTLSYVEEFLPEPAAADYGLYWSSFRDGRWQVATPAEIEQAIAERSKGMS